ncbi:mucin-2-like isoform X2 [Ochlerotatus camptorhynchus]|uniref:mucin-2-like isoform X2 n=1 Tax=Ochlerotatus camptorhynchus TaxID=644619 RepID=UPI0031D315B3
MDDETEYNDGDIVWVKLSYCWWPGEVMAGDRLTEEFLSTLKRRPLVVVKFFDEDSYEFVKNTNFIYKYNCNRKNEFLRKGLEQFRAKNKHMEKFPADVMHAERTTGGDPNIVNSNDFLPQKRESYAGIFGDKNKGRASVGGKNAAKKVVSPSKIIPVITVKKHEVRILAQASSLTGISVGSRSLSSSLGAAASSLPSTPRPATGLSSSGVSINSSSSSSPAQIYHCYKCGFESSRQNVIMVHTKYCRAVPMNIPSVKVVKPAKPIAATTEKTEQDVTLKESPPTPNKVEDQTPPKTEIEEKIETIAEGEELVEVIQVLEQKPTRGHASRTPRAAVPMVKATPKTDRRRNRGRARETPTLVEDESDEKVEVLMEVTEEKEEHVKEKKEETVKVEAVAELEVETKTVEDSIEKDDKDSKVKVELKNELLADWSEDEQDDQDDQEDSVKEDENVKNEEPDRTETTENTTVTTASSLETSLDKSAECSPQLASPVSSATTIKYRNIPKKQKREFIEVTNDQPVVSVASTIEKSSSESSISTTAATCGGDTPTTTSDKTQISIDSLTERPISAKQRILDRATRGSSKSVSSDEAKQESLMKVVTLESQLTADEDFKKETSCFDFQEDEEEEVVLNKSPRRSLSNRRDTSLELNSTVPDPVKDQEEQERAKKDAELKTEIESLLCETSIPSCPELPKITKALSPVPSSSSAVETPPQLKEEIDRNRTLPPKERGKRIFKTRNKIIENEAIALEQSKAIVMDFVKKSHEEELAELLEQQRAEAKLSSESPTTTNDDSQESILSNEPARFENSEFAAIKSKRTKISHTENVLNVSDKTDIAQEPSVSSTNETKATETESLPVSISKDQLALDSLASAATPKGRKGRQRKSATPVVEKPTEEVPEVEQKQEPRVEDATPKARKKRGGELQNLDLKALDTPRSRRGRSVKAEEPAVVQEEPAKVVEEPVVATTSSERHRKSKRAKKEEELEKEQPSSKGETVNKQHVMEVPTPVVEEPKEELKVPKLKRSKQLQQRSADSTAEIVPEILDEPSVPTTENDEPATPVEPAPEPSPPVKQQPIKMIIKSKGRKSNSELLYEPTVVSPEPKEDEVKEKLPKSPKSSKRKKTPVEEPVEPLVVDTPPEDATLVQSTSIKSLKSKRSKLRTEPPKASDKIPEETPSSNLVSTDPSATDLQIAEALIHLPDVTPPKPVVVEDQEMIEIKPNSSSPIPTTTVATAKTINPRKRHLQTLMSSPELVEQPQQPNMFETVTIPEKKIRETVEVVSDAPVSIVLDEPAVTEAANIAQVDEDKFDIDNIPIVMDDSELIDDSTISTTTTSNQKSTEETVQPIPSAKPMTKKLVIVKNSNGSSKIVGSKESPPREITSPVSKKNLGIKSTTITIKPPADQLSPKATRSPAHSPPIRGAQLVQSSSGGQIVITSKGTVLTTQSPATSSARSSRTGGPKTHVTPAKVGSIVSSVSSVGTISSSTSKSPPTPSAPTSHRSSSETPIKSSIKICVQSQEIIHSPSKARSKAVDSATSQKKTPSSSTFPPKKVLMKKHSDASTSSSGKPLFSTSKGAPIKPQPATSSAVSPGKKPHKVIKISPQKLKEFTRLGMVEDKGQGKVLTASGMKKFRQEQNQLQQQKPLPEEPKKTPRADSVDEEPSTSTPTPPPPTEAPAEVVVAAAADSSVKEIPAAPMEVEELTDIALAASSSESLERPSSPAEVVETVPTEPSSTEENEADAAIKEPEAESSRPVEKEASTTPVDEPSESAPVPVSAEVTTEATESGSNVQESSQLIAVPAENFGGPSNLFYLCSVREEGFVPVNNELLYLDSSNQLVALPEHASVEDIVNQAEVLEIPAGSEQATVVTATATVDGEGSIEAGQQNILLNTQDGQQIILDQQSLMALAAGGDTSQLLTPDGQQILLQGSAQELLAALAVSQPGLGIVAAEGTQIIVASESLIDLQDPPLPGEIIQVNPNTTVETNAVLTKPPIMSAVEVPTKNGNGAEASANFPEQRAMEPASSNLDESLAAVIGVPGNPNVPTSLELPITVTNPVIAKTTTCKINPIYPSTTSISAMALDPELAAVAAGTVLGLPTVAQTDSLTAIKSIWD